MNATTWPCRTCGAPTAYTYCDRHYVPPRREACAACGKRKKHRQFVHLVAADGTMRAVCHPDLVGRRCMDRVYRGERIDWEPRRVRLPPEAA